MIVHRPAEARRAAGGARSAARAARSGAAGARPVTVRIGLAALAGSTGGAFFAAGMSTEVLKPVIM
ncbi:sulfite exporter TauE/SafE family protein, partial [Streptomyces minutiscleroticus]